MKKTSFLFMAAAVMLAASCNNSDSSDALSGTSAGNETEVTLTFSPYDVEPLTRTTTSIADVVTHLDVWITEGDNTVTVHQTNSDDNFGTVSVSLNRLKTYQLTAVAHRANGAATLTDGIIAFPEDKTTQSMIYQTSFSPGTTTSLNCLMQRIVGMFRFEITDAVPDDARNISFALGSSYNRWNVTSAIGTNATDRTVTFNNFSRDANGANFSIYIIPTNLTATDEIDVTVTTYYENGDEYEQKVFADVPVKAGYKTTYRGEFFTTESVAAAFTVTDWEEFAAVNF